MGAARALGVAGAGAGEAAAGAVLTGDGIEVGDDDGTAAGGDDASSVVFVRPSTVTGCSCWPATRSTALQEQAASSSAESSKERLRRMFFKVAFGLRQGEKQ